MEKPIIAPEMRIYDQQGQRLYLSREERGAFLKDWYSRSFLGIKNSKGHVFFKYKFLKGHTYGAELNLEHDYELLTHTVFKHQFQDFY